MKSRKISEKRQTELKESNRQIKLLQLQKDNLILQFLESDQRAREILNKIEKASADQQKLLSIVFGECGCKPEDWLLDVESRSFSPRPR